MGAASGSGASRSESRLSVEVRGIYTTPLTALMLAAGFAIARPSPATRQRFDLPEHPGPADARVDDLPDRQGVVIRGRVEAVSRVVHTLRRRLPFALFWRDEAGQAAFFTQPVKQYFDGLRARYVPTVPGYYRLRTLGIEPPELTDLAEGTRVYRQLERELVWARLEPGREFTIVHLKAGGQVVRLRGTVDRVGEEYLVVRRGFRPGRVFDSLDEPMLPGDWGLVVLPAGRWWARRLYYREDGTFIGEVVNLNTPVEVFPDRAVYVDLELDIVRMPDGTLRIVDADDLEAAVRRGRLSPALAQRAYEEAYAVVLKLAARGFGETEPDRL
jgi:protein associated with RNAse G/E